MLVIIFCHLHRKPAFSEIYKRKTSVRLSNHANRHGSDRGRSDDEGWRNRAMMGGIFNPHHSETPCNNEHFLRMGSRFCLPILRRNMGSLYCESANEVENIDTNRPHHSAPQHASKVSFVCLRFPRQTHRLIIISRRRRRVDIFIFHSKALSVEEKIYTFVGVFACEKFLVSHSTIMGCWEWSFDLAENRSLTRHFCSPIY